MKWPWSAPLSGPAALLPAIERTGWAILALLCLGALFFAPAVQAGAIALGGAAGLGNLRCMDLYFSRLFSRRGARGRWWHHVLYAGRFIGLAGIVASALAWGELPVVGLAVGLSVPGLAIVVCGIRPTASGPAATGL